MRPYYPSTWLRPATPIMDTTEPLLDRQANLHKWGLAASEISDCGQRQTMGHIVDSCPLMQLDGGLTILHEADDDAVIRLKTMAATALAK